MVSGIPGVKYALRIMLISTAVIHLYCMHLQNSKYKERKEAQCVSQTRNCHHQGTVRATTRFLLRHYDQKRERRSSVEVIPA
jgi:hypothetical protein